MEDRGQICSFVNENYSLSAVRRRIDKIRSKSQENFECG